MSYGLAKNAAKESAYCFFVFIYKLNIRPNKAPYFGIESRRNTEAFIDRIWGKIHLVKQNDVG